MTPTEPEAFPAGPEARAAAVLDLARAGQFAEIRELFTAGLRPLVTAAALQAAWEAALAEHGRLASVGPPASEPFAGDMVAVKIPLTFERGALTLAVYLTPAGQLTGLQLEPPGGAEPAAPWERPGYADPARFDELDVTLGSGPLAVPGTLSLPDAPGPLPAVVLLGGSGPTDRDGTIFRSRPLKDLAWGLASGGVAVLRFDKVAYAHPDEVRANRAFTVVDEYQPDALAAIALLKSHPAIDATRVFLAGGAEPLQWAAVRQVRYIASLDPATAASAEPGIDAMTAQAGKVDDPGLSPETPDDELPFGVPAPYWLDLRRYDPVATAAGLGKPMLILQGGRDYQATVADDLSRWQAGLARRPEVTIRVYPPDNHFFFPGTGPSRPAELATAQHVDPDVIADIRDWLTAGR